MTKVVVHISRIVVQGGDGFVSEVFGESLRQEIAHRIGQGLSAQEIADKLRGSTTSLQYHATTVEPARTSRGGSTRRSTEGMAASVLAGRLVK